MDNTLKLTLIFTLLSLFSFALGIIYRKKVTEAKRGSAEKEAAELKANAIREVQALKSNALKDAESTKKEIILEAKEESIKLKVKVEEEIRQLKAEISDQEKRISQKEEVINKKTESIEKKEQSLEDKKNHLEKKQEELKEILEKEKEALEQISKFSPEEAKQYLLNSIKEEIRGDMSKILREEELRTKDEANKKAREIIVTAMQRCSTDYVSEATVSVVQLPSDDMKGRIIGREGRNIRAIEAITGIDLIIDDTPDAVVLSGFDPIRREIARMTLEKLINDGRIHPTKIEEAVEKSKQELEEIIKEESKKACFELGVNIVDPELAKLVGKLRFRTSYGQNVLMHSIEVGTLAGYMATELGENALLAKRAGLLHDIGKAVDYEREGTHVDLGVDICRKFGENDVVINSVASHHGDVEAKSVIATIIQIADAISASRPGARKETLETYVQRLKKLEEIGMSQNGVDKVFAIQAGREVRIIVVPEVVKDDEMHLLAREVAKKIEESVEYPGQIKVNVVRETRAVDLAK